MRFPGPVALDSTVMMKDKSPSPMSSQIKQPPAPTSVDSYLLEVADAVNRTLDLNTLLQRIAEMLKRVIDYEIFAILLLNEKTQELRVRFQVGHPPEVAERIRIKVGQGVTGQAVQRRETVLVNDCLLYTSPSPRDRTRARMPS